MFGSVRSVNGFEEGKKRKKNCFIKCPCMRSIQLRESIIQTKTSVFDSTHHSDSHFSRNASAPAPIWTPVSDFPHFSPLRVCRCKEDEKSKLIYSFSNLSGFFHLRFTTYSYKNRYSNDARDMFNCSRLLSK